MDLSTWHVLSTCRHETLLAHRARLTKPFKEGGTGGKGRRWNQRLRSIRVEAGLPRRGGWGRVARSTVGGSIRGTVCSHKHGWMERGRVPEKMSRQGLVGRGDGNNFNGWVTVGGNVEHGVRPVDSGGQAGAQAGSFEARAGAGEES